MAETTKLQLGQHMLRNLGAPVIQVNVSEEQIDDAINEALQFWREYHADAQERTYIAKQLSQAEIDANAVTLPDNVLSVVKVIDPNVYGASSIRGDILFNFEYHLMYQTVWDVMQSGGISSYVVAKQYLSDLDNILSPAPPFRFNMYTSKLSIDQPISRYFEEGNYLVAEVYAYLDETIYTKIWGDRFLRNLATAYLKKKWGVNLSKFNGVTLPSGIILNGMEILAEANRDIQDAEAAIEAYQRPHGLIIA